MRRPAPFTLASALGLAGQLAWLAAGPHPAAAQADDHEDVRPPPGDTASAGTDPGRLIDRRVVAFDTAMSYAVFLPPGWSANRAWPSLMLMDPRGRALHALELFREAAAERRWIILSSYDTSSDEPTSVEDSRAAVQAVLNDALETYSLDPRRIHLAGFSGTARLAWAMAASAPQHFPAILGFGGGVTGMTLVSMRAAGVDPPSFFGGAGTEDFNYREMWRTDAALDELGRPHALRYYAGGHAWPPADIAAAAVEWLELDAQRRGLSAVDSAWVRSRLEAAVEEARSLEREGRAHDALLAYRRLLGTFEPFGFLDHGPIERVRTAVEELARDRAVRRTDARLLELLDREERTGRRLADALALLDGRRIPALDRLTRAARLDDLHRQAAARDTLEAQSARRQLAVLAARAGFYRARDLLARGDTARAVRSLELAHRARPDSRAVCQRFLALDAAGRRQSRELTSFCVGDPP